METTSVSNKYTTLTNVLKQCRVANTVKTIVLLWLKLHFHFNRCLTTSYSKWKLMQPSSCWTSTKPQLGVTRRHLKLFFFSRMWGDIQITRGNYGATAEHVCTYICAWCLYKTSACMSACTCVCVCERAIIRGRSVWHLHHINNVKQNRH